MKFGDFRYNKVLFLLLSILFFSIIYFLFNDDNFMGVNLITETIRKELLKTEVKEDINEVKIIESMSNYSYYKEDDDEIDKKVENIEKEVEEEYNPENVNKSFFEQYFNRLYFSVITGCLLGYGDIYPRTLFLKFFVMIQSLLTIIIIIS
tara:strand:- start:175 stop:624 length:450 start_codon:yes stop_codon:yes gene_type:complete